MPVLSGLAVFLQVSDQTQRDIHLSTVYLGIIAIVFIVLVLALVIGGVVALVLGSRLVRRAEKMTKMVEEKAMPVIDKADALMLELMPKIRSISADAEQISHTVRAKVDELSATVSQLNETVLEINGRARVQVVRVDGMVSEALQTTEEISKTVQNGIRVPVRQIAGILAGVKAGIETLVARSPFHRPGATREGGQHGTSSSPLDL